jgi:hypothetical protein
LYGYGFGQLDGHVLGPAEDWQSRPEGGLIMVDYENEPPCYIRVHVSSVVWLLMGETHDSAIDGDVEVDAQSPSPSQDEK